MAIQFSGLASGLDTDNIIKELMAAERLSVEKVEKKKIKLEWKKDIWQEMNTKIYDFYTNQVFDLKSSGAFSQKQVSTGGATSISVDATVNAPTGTHKVKVTQLAKGAYLNSGTVNDETHSVGSDATFTLTDGTNTVNDITLTAGMGINDLISAINNAGLDIKASYDSNFDRVLINTTKTGPNTKIEFSSLNDEAQTLFGQMGFVVNGAGSDEVNISANIGENGQEAIFEYNGITGLTSDDNTVTINGLDLTFNTDTAGAEIDIVVTQDTDAIYNKVKDFLTEYNQLLVDINEKLGADSAREYEPLTDEEKEAMSDDEIKLWEDKIKDSLLRRDTTLDSLLSSMRNIVGSSFGVDTSSFDYNYLSDLGIVTGDYSEKGILHINGDEDDSLYAIKTNTLKEAIQSDPDKVAELFNAIGDELYSTMQEKMKSTEISSALTFFNDKQIDEQVSDYEDEIAALEERLVAIEKRYYSQFTAMEQAIQAMNNQSASLASMLGGA